MTAHPLQIQLDKAPAVEFDASPWGFGAVLRRRGVPVAYFAGSWTDENAKFVGTQLGDPAGQTSWEQLTLFMSLVMFGANHMGHGVGSSRRQHV